MFSQIYIKYYRNIMLFPNTDRFWLATVVVVVVVVLSYHLFKKTKQTYQQKDVLCDVEQEIMFENEFLVLNENRLKN